MVHPEPVGDIPLLIGGQGERKTLRPVAEHADIWHSLTTPEEYGLKSGVLAAHCEALAWDPGPIERSGAIWGEIVTGRDRGGLIARGQALADLGVTLPTIGCDGPDYDLTGAAALCRWRDTR